MYLVGAFVNAVAQRNPSISETVSLFGKRYKLSDDTRRKLLKYFLSLSELTSTVRTTQGSHRHTDSAHLRLAHTAHLCARALLTDCGV